MMTSDAGGRTFWVPAAVVLSVLVGRGVCQQDRLTLESPAMAVRIDRHAGRWSLEDKQAGVRWPSQGTASPGTGEGLPQRFADAVSTARSVRLARDGVAVTFQLIDEGRSLEIRYEGNGLDEIRVLEDGLATTEAEDGYLIVPCREGLLIPASGEVTFRRTFGTSDYEGCHMNMLGLVKRGAALVVSWDDAYVFADVARTETDAGARRLTAALRLRKSARSIRLTPLGRGDWNRVAAGYRRLAERKGLAVTLRQKIERDPHAELLVGASDFKLWTCLARRMNEESTKEESVTVRWTFDQAAAIAQHLHGDVQIDRCLFIMGGWTEGGYDCRHPDNLPANPECGGNEALARAIHRIQSLGYVACLHDNYQDMYRDAKSWDAAYIEKRPDGSLVKGGRWLGGRAYMVCAPKQYELAMRPQNLPAIHRLFDPWCYFIDTTYAVGPRECFDPNHPIGRNEDIAWKIKLSDAARQLFGLFGSECGREWALPHSDFFEGLVGVSGRHYHNLDPKSLGAMVIPFWEMVYHDCQFCYGKYGYAPGRAAPYVAHHVLCARPLHYHAIPDGLYWKATPPARRGGADAASSGPEACYIRTDQGWAQGLHPLDAFIKNTHEVLGPLHRMTAHQRLERLELLTSDRSLRRATYGHGAEATVVVVNFRTSDATVESRYGGSVTLPAWGFVVEGPRFTAFYAKRWGGREYPEGALFTIQARGGRALDRTTRVRIFHGFGDPAIHWRGKTWKVERERELSP
ncbi:MAG TPA: hypothetical protein EYP56_05985 [Planctomycetaceae bacterium]|nr:hypothetical protein [Planctomycetaceae bacterium]